MADTDSQPLLRVSGLTKRFPGVLALDNVDLTLYPGEVLAVIGENGAGKSTLMKIMAGVQGADSGNIKLDGQEADLSTVRKATDLGVSLIHQELNLADNLDVAANIFLGRESAKWGFIPRRTLADKARTLLNDLDVNIDPATLVSRLSIGRRQLVEIAKALSTDARILIMDEPTSSLSQKETETLYTIIDTLRSRGVSIIYISHRLAEVKRLADRVTVLRDGRNAGELARSEINHDAMVSLMVGRDLDRSRHRTPLDPGEPVLEISGLTTPAHPGQTVDLTIRAGEIVGIAGLVGAGRTELLETLFGVTPALSGEIRINGEAIVISSPKAAIRAGMGLVPEDRKQQGLIVEMAVRENITLASMDRHSRKGFISASQERATSAESMKRLNIKAPTDRIIVEQLSGGNQQKVVIGKWLAVQPRLLLLDEPTRGIDVGAKGEIYQLMDALAKQGVAILFVSSEMEEILTQSDRVYVMHEGRIAGELAHHEIGEEAVMQLATGAASTAKV